MEHLSLLIFYWRYSALAKQSRRAWWRLSSIFASFFVLRSLSYDGKCLEASLHWKNGSLSEGGGLNG